MIAYLGQVLEVTQQKTNRVNNILFKIFGTNKYLTDEQILVSSPNATEILHQGYEKAGIQIGDEFGNGRQKELSVQLILASNAFKVNSDIDKVMSGSLSRANIKINRKVSNILSVSINDGVAIIKFKENTVTNSPHTILFNRTDTNKLESLNISTEGAHYKVQTKDVLENSKFYLQFNITNDNIPTKVGKIVNLEIEKGDSYVPYSGKITSINSDGTFNLELLDGNVLENVSIYIYLLTIEDSSHLMIMMLIVKH